MSQKIASAFEFFDLGTPIHKTDPRTKLLFIISYSVLLFLFDQLMIQTILLLLLLPIIIIGKIAKTITNTLKDMAFLFVIIIIINTLLVSFNYGLMMTIRFANILITFSILFQTTTPDDLTQAATKLGISYDLAFSLSLAFRFIPTIARETEIIRDAQISRGYDVRKKGIINQIRNLFPILIPLIINSIKRAYYVAESLEARSFGAKNVKRVNLFPLKFTYRDLLMFLWVCIILSLGIYVRINITLLPEVLLYNLPI